MSASPRISIITPVKNAQAYLPDALASVSKQTFTDYEHLLIVTPEEYPKLSVLAGPKVRVLATDADYGPGYAMNFGVKMAQAEIVAFLCADDFYVHNQVFFQVLSCFDKHPATDVIHGNINIVDRESKKVVRANWRGHTWGMGFGMGLNLPTFFMKRQLLLARPLDESIHYADDYDFALELLLRGQRFKHLGEAYVNFRRGGRSETVSKKVLRQEMRQIRSKYLATPTRQLFYCFGFLVTALLRLEQNLMRR